MLTHTHTPAQSFSFIVWSLLETGKQWEANIMGSAQHVFEKIGVSCFPAVALWDLLLAVATNTCQQD